MVSGRASKGIDNNMKFLEENWGTGDYKLVLEKIELTKRWPDEAQEVKEELMEWMTENEITTMVEEGEDILDGLEAMLTEETSEVTDEVLMDAREIITAITVAFRLETHRMAPEGWK